MSDIKQRIVQSMVNAEGKRVWREKQFRELRHYARLLSDNRTLPGHRLHELLKDDDDPDSKIIREILSRLHGIVTLLNKDESSPDAP